MSNEDTPRRTSDELDINGLDYFTFPHTPFVSCWQQYFYSYIVLPQPTKEAAQ